MQCKILGDYRMEHYKVFIFVRLSSERCITTELLRAEAVRRGKK